jgi:hypothetical protein
VRAVHEMNLELVYRLISGGILPSAILPILVEDQQKLGAVRVESPKLNADVPPGKTRGRLRQRRL